MKVEKAPIQKESKASIHKRLEAKFGKNFSKDKSIPKEDSVEISQKSKDHKFKLKTDITDNDPNSEVTQEKLKALLRTGAFHFNDGERRALTEILKP